MLFFWGSEVLMNAKEAVISYSQAEKIKAGIIWVSHAVEVIRGLPPQDWQGAESMIKTIIDMIANEIHLAKKLLNDDAWGDVIKKMDTAIVMINSGVAYESTHHLTQALSHVTNICHRAMSALRDEGLI
jgi:hypothetical protein